MVNDSWNYHWVTSTIITVWTGLYTWHYIISIFFFWCFVSRKGKWHDKWPCCFKITVEWFGCCDWTIEVSVTTKMYLSVLSATAWELKSNADLLCEIWVCWQVLIRVVVKIKAAVWNVKWGSSKLALCMHQETWPVIKFLSQFFCKALNGWHLLSGEHKLWKEIMTYESSKQCFISIIIFVVLSLILRLVRHVFLKTFLIQQ